MTDVGSAMKPDELRSLSAIRAAHVALRKRIGQIGPEQLAPTTAEQIDAFIEAVERSGAWLRDPNDRHDAQLLLDEWAATRATTSDLAARDWALPRLAEAVPEGDPTEGGGPASSTGDIARARKQIRLAALARQWRVMGRRPGYLLSGSALRDAQDFRESDPEIADFVQASERAATRKMRGWIAGLVALVLALSGLTVFAVHQWRLADERALEAEQAHTEQRREVVKLNRVQADLTETLRKLQATREQAERDVGEVTTSRIRDLDQQTRQLTSALALIQQGLQRGQLSLDDVPDELRPLLQAQSTVPALARDGYDPLFLPSRRAPLAMPRPISGASGMVLSYHNYSLAMSAERRMPIVAASNLDRSRLRVLPRAGGRFAPDPRLSQAEQLDSTWFRRAGYDRGHLVSRSNIAWGDLAPEDAVAAQQIAAQADVLTNATPQTEALNRRGWMQLERWALTEHNPTARKVTIFSGPVLHPNDPIVDSVQVPRAFFKVIVSTRSEVDVGPDVGSEPTSLVVDAFLMRQFADGTDEPLGSIEFDATSARATIPELERLTGLDFGEAVRAAERFRDSFEATVQQIAEQRGRAEAPLRAVAQLDSNERGARLAAAQQLVDFVRAESNPAAERSRVVAALLDEAEPPSLRSKSASGRVNVLFVLSEVPQASWDDWVALRARARRVVADVEAAGPASSLGAQSRSLLEALKRRLGFNLAGTYTVYTHFISVPRTDVEGLARALTRLGWRVPPIEQVSVGRSVNEVRYGPAADREIAELLAADIRAAGFEQVRARQLAGVRRGVLEIWISDGPR